MLSEEQIADGWKPHDGGPCPVPSETMAEILLQMAAEHQRPRARDWETVNYEADGNLVSALVNNAPALLAALTERDALKAENERFREIVGFLHVAFAAYAESGAQLEAIALAKAALEPRP